MRHRDKDYTVYPRVLRSGKTVYYYQTYDEQGRRTNPKSTGIGYTRKRDEARAKREAEKYCQELAEQNILIRQKSPTLEEFVSYYHFWEWGRSTYVRNILARSGKDRPGITEQYCKHARGITQNHILPHHGGKRIEAITAYDCEQLLFRWGESAAPGTANQRMTVYSTMLSEYERMQKMRNQKSQFFNPWRLVQPLRGKSKPAGAISMEDAQKILADKPSEGLELIYYMAIKLALFSGLRIGELLGLRCGDIKDEEITQDGVTLHLSYIEVSGQWSKELNRRTLTKTKDSRNVPLIPALREELREIETTKKSYLFSAHPSKAVPLGQSTIRKALYRRLENAGINREEKGITFHSCRRFFNTLLRHGGVSDDMLRRFTGHRSEAMTDHYTDYLAEDLLQIAKAQEKMIKNL